MQNICFFYAQSKIIINYVMITLLRGKDEFLIEKN